MSESETLFTVGDLVEVSVWPAGLPSPFSKWQGRFYEYDASGSCTAVRDTVPHRFGMVVSTYASRTHVWVSFGGRRILSPIVKLALA